VAGLILLLCVIFVVVSVTVKKWLKSVYILKVIAKLKGVSPF